MASTSAVGEDRQPLEHPLLGGFEQRVAPFDRRPEGLLALGHVAGRAAEELEAAAEPVAQRLRREQAEAGGRELDRERQAVEPAADLGDRRGVVVGHVEVGAHGAGAVDEQLDRLDRLQLGRGDPVPDRRRQAERRHGIDVLDADVERLAAGDQQLHLRALVEQLGRHPGGRRHLLEVVEHEQDLPLAQAVGELVPDRPSRRLPHPDRATERDEDGVGVAGGRQVHERRRRRGTGPSGRRRPGCARLVLPVPPGPVSVRRRIAGSSRRRSTASSSARRPTNGGARRSGRLATLSKVVSGGNVGLEVGVDELEDALGAARGPRSRYSPRSRRLAPCGQAFRSRGPRPPRTGGPGRRDRPP